ncbi:hypothetical protein [Flocculibacter collagenilyticus]|uniref:hypothetical protein n=1 Tax=Flocculibacter collagenilyticus TaxID=2744479 RepID=UPI0018F31772|nr:hypothetical protein [Flocculibacter collagenilyticus]
MNCWICGTEAKTGEHLVKASDLKSVFGSVSQKKPLYIHNKDEKNIRLNSIKRGSVIKSKALICAFCNNARTAPHDRAWEKLSNYLRNKIASYSSHVVKLNRVFPGEIKSQMLNVHLYFAKLFGCSIKESEIAIDLTQFQKCILQGKAHPSLYISFGMSNGMLTGNTNIRIDSINNGVKFASWFYIVGSLAVNIMYAAPCEKRRGLDKAWHPYSISKKLKLVKY